MKINESMLYKNVDIWNFDRCENALVCSSRVNTLTLNVFWNWILIISFMIAECSKCLEILLCKQLFAVFDFYQQTIGISLLYSKHFYSQSNICWDIRHMEWRNSRQSEQFRRSTCFMVFSEFLVASKKLHMKINTLYNELRWPIMGILQS